MLFQVEENTRSVEKGVVLIDQAVEVPRYVGVDLVAKAERAHRIGLDARGMPPIRRTSKGLPSTSKAVTWLRLSTKFLS